MIDSTGIDSLLAPFLTLNFDDDARCFCCLQALIRRLLNGFFRRDSNALQGHLLIFRQLLAYHDPELGTHLYRLGFHPELFAVSWFLTLFTRSFSFFPIASLFSNSSDLI